MTKGLLQERRRLDSGKPGHTRRRRVFFIALRHVGKNFEKITSKVQSKNKDQVRHYYYRVIRRINKVLGPGFSLDAKNTKDANSAMLRWWSLLEKQSCSASKLHLKPRRFKTFVTALEHQLLKDRVKANQKRKPSRAVSVVVTPVARKSTACAQDSAKANVIDHSCSSKVATGKTRNHKRQEPSEAPKRRKKGSDCGISAAAIKRWEKAASAGVSLVAEAAEQVEREASEQLGQVNVRETKLCPQQGLTDPSLLADAMEGTMEDGKLRLQLYPVDEPTRKSMEQDGLNPYLQLTLKPRKSISSVVRHLIQKWGRSSAAMGDLRLFPFSAQMENGVSCKNWSIHDASVNAGDVYSSLGNPTLFRLRYGWLPECLSLSVVRGDVGLQASGPMNVPMLPSSYVHPCLPFCAKSCTIRGPENHTQSTEPVDNDQSFVEPIRLQNTQLSGLTTMAVTQHNQVNADKSNHISCLDRADGLMPMDVRKDINTFGQGPADRCIDGEKVFIDTAGQKVLESGDNNVASCSWLYEGSNDSFIQRIWATEDSPGTAAPLLPSEIDWADTLTNISVGEFLNEVSQAGHLTSGLASVQAFQQMQSLDSFDAAVAAQGVDVSGIESRLMQNSDTSAWDGEETCDAFAFQKMVSQRRTSAPTQHSLEPQSSASILRVAAPFVDCGSLEAWKQSFSHVEPSLPEDLRFSSQQLEYLANGNSSQGFTWARVQGISSSKDDPFSSRAVNVTCEMNAEKVQSTVKEQGGQPLSDV